MSATSIAAPVDEKKSDSASRSVNYAVCKGGPATVGGVAADRYVSQTDQYYCAQAAIMWANRYVNGHVGFTMGWDFYYTKTVICCAQISATTGMVQYWDPSINPAIIVFANLVLSFLLKVGGPSRYGEFEVWFFILKIFRVQVTLQAELNFHK
ncbi:uncharacterized protein B0I36DRAFT_369547 [Microdochium trichocladiopsis]|uniref:Amino acid permease/ SLC12A domain-containing protein n=1 Tax=Microdochium trichocladiopsis TaxID=1682393 RepID=A0A9P9BGE6_9PEZI|nr:uncharacterized protein B0I36DRAFT_369547 [Microdochium trichocladiopsis]KAH7014609.1 hypothetical protein B0I36DRAFT_369547 [Microdochium trichocladiopsis]